MECCCVDCILAFIYLIMAQDISVKNSIYQTALCYNTEGDNVKRMYIYI